MIRRIFSALLFVAMISSCNNQGTNVTATKNAKAEEPLTVAFDSLAANPDNYVGKNIIVEGKVVHVCTESGKKMFVVGTNPDLRLYVAAGENISKFPMELLGSQISVEGVITRAGGPAKPMAENAGEAGKQGMAGDNCETETALAEQPSLANIVMQYRSHIVK